MSWKGRMWEITNTWALLLFLLLLLSFQISISRGLSRSLESFTRLTDASTMASTFSILLYLLFLAGSYLYNPNVLLQNIEMVKGSRIEIDDEKEKPDGS